MVNKRFKQKIFILKIITEIAESLELKEHRINNFMVDSKEKIHFNDLYEFNPLTNNWNSILQIHHKNHLLDEDIVV